MTDLRDLTVPPQIGAYCVFDTVSVSGDSDVLITVAVMKSQTYRSIRLRLPWSQAEELWSQLGKVLGR